jgi:hypothetical protein
LLNKARMSKFQGYETLYAQAVQKLASQQGQPE